jgi:hypothetical protein
MSLKYAIGKAYDDLVKKNWDTIYLSCDIHGTIFENDYNGLPTPIPDAIESLKIISSFKEVKLILWSSVFPKDQRYYVKILSEAGVKVSYFNENPEVPNTKMGDFGEKFYFSVLIDDKAGFDPRSWRKVINDWSVIRVKFRDIILK